MKKILTFCLLFSTLVIAFEPGERIALQMKPGWLSIKGETPTKTIINGINKYPNKLSAQLLYHYDINETEYKNIIKDIESEKLFQTSFYDSYFLKLDTNNTYQDLLLEYKKKCTNFNYLDDKSSKYTDDISTQCNIYNEEITKKQIEIFKSQKSLFNVELNATKSIGEFSKYRNDIIKTINENINDINNKERLKQYITHYLYLINPKYIVNPEKSNKSLF